MKHYKIFTLFIFLIILASCSKDFLEVAPLDQYSTDIYFKNDEQLYSGGASLYNRPWFFFNEKFVLCMEVYSANAQGTWSDIAQFNNFAVDGSNQFLTEGYQSMFAVVAFANNLLDIAENKAGPNVSEEAISITRGESLFMRAVAYYYLVRTFGPVPILEDIEQYGTDVPVYRNRVEDVYTLIERDLLEAAELLPTSWDESNAGRATKGAANGMLSEMYLTLKDYANARTYAELVINSGLYTLMPNYGDIFHPRNNNGVESIFELQWISTSQNQRWTVTNTHQAYLAAASILIQTGAGWGTFIPGISFINDYEAGDLRRYYTIMEEGNFYPELVTSQGGFLVENPMTANYAGFRKYVIGSADEWEGVRGQQNSDGNTHILRYAEVLLIRAEAILGSSASTTDPTALGDINAVRARAGLPALSTVTQDDILHERRMELVLEGDYWYDMARIDRQKATTILGGYDRATLIDNNDPNSGTDAWYVTPTESHFLLPLPQSETVLNPLLNEPPVAYDFTK